MPDRDEYYSGDDCLPKRQGRGCYGDCFDCFQRDVEREIDAAEVAVGGRQLPLWPELQPNMIRGRVCGLTPSQTSKGK